MTDKQLIRFLEAQNQMYLKALHEMRNGRKITHWMWYIFPQLKGLGNSENSNFYGISGLEEAAAYLEHPVLGKHLTEISEVLLDIQGKTAAEIFGSTDHLKLHSSMTLFSKVAGNENVFVKVLNQYFDGKGDVCTEELLSENTAVD